MNNVHEDDPIVFQTRWAMSYLRGPLTRDQIRRLMTSRKQTPPSVQTSIPITSAVEPSESTSVLPPPPRQTRPVVPPDVPEFFVPSRRRPELISTALPSVLLGVARLHYADKKAHVDQWETLALAQVVISELPAEVWNESEPFDFCVPEL